MASDYIMIVGRLDAERFRRFRTGEDVAAARSLDRGHACANVWALSSASGAGAWERLRRGDRILFAEAGSRFVACGTVSSTMRDGSAPVLMWGDTPRMRALDRLILFSGVIKISEPFSETCRAAGVDPVEFTLLQESKTGSVAQLGTLRLPDPSPPPPAGIVTLPLGANGPAERATEAVTRLVRDTAKVRQIKRMYDGRCQVCGLEMDVPGPLRYSEVHHIRPLGRGGDDDYGNMLVLRPNHHVEFDYMAIGLSADGTAVVDRGGRPTGRLTMVQGHAIDPKNIAFHRAGMRLP